MSSVSCAEFWKTDSQCCRYLSYRPRVFWSRLWHPSSTSAFCRLARKSVLTGPHSMRDTLQEDAAGLSLSAPSPWRPNMNIRRKLEQLKTDWMLKCCRRMAKLSHAPSTANLLAQYTSLKGRPARDHRVLAISSIDVSNFHKKKTPIPLTVKPPGAAGHQNVTLAPSLHVWQEGLDGLDGTEEIDLQDFPHWLHRLHLYWAHQTHASVAHWKRRGQRRSRNKLHSASGIAGRTQNVYPFLHNPRRRLQDGLPAGHVHLEYVQGVLVEPFNAFQKAFLFGQISHCRIN